MLPPKVQSTPETKGKWNAKTESPESISEAMELANEFFSQRYRSDSFPEIMVAFKTPRVAKKTPRYAVE